MTTDDILETEAILNALGGSDGRFPRAALKQAVDRWSEVGPALLALLQAEADGAERSDRVEAILGFGIYLMAQMHETRAFRPLCRIAANGERMSELIGDGITEDLSAIFVRVYDGDQGPLRLLIEAFDADEFARDAALEALARLTAAGRIDRSETVHYLRDLYTTMVPQQESYVWVGWQQAIAKLGLDALAPIVEDAFDRGWIDPSVMDVGHFHKDLGAAKAAAVPMDVFEPYESRLDDITTYLSGAYSYPGEQSTIPGSVARPLSLANDATVRNPYRGVGRNDPCPCGSGKKFKKCCLDEVR